MLNCFVKKLLGLFFMAIYYVSMDLGYKPPKKNLATLLPSRKKYDGILSCPLDL